MTKMNQLIEKRIRIAHQLYEGKCGADYREAVIILVSIISGIASKIWPGKQKDRKRFVETIIQYTANELNTELVSVPLLLQDLEMKDKGAFDIIKKTSYLYGRTRVFEGYEIDKTEQRIIELCPNLQIKDIRRFSYTNIFYDEVRSGLIHEYKTSEKVASEPMHDLSKSVSYVNNLSLNEIIKFSEFKPYHTIFFHFEWIEQVVNSLKESLDSL